MVNIYLGKAKPSGGGGGEAVIEELNVTPSTSAQTITAGSGVDGYSPVNVSAVTASIDANIVAGNIKSGVDILNVTGTYTGDGTETYQADLVLKGVVDGLPQPSESTVVTQASTILQGI